MPNPSYRSREPTIAGLFPFSLAREVSKFGRLSFDEIGATRSIQLTGLWREGSNFKN
jgi:hypothetical protein